jgi:hypothetical protein
VRRLALIVASFTLATAAPAFGQETQKWWQIAGCDAPSLQHPYRTQLDRTFRFWVGGHGGDYRAAPVIRHRAKKLWRLVNCSRRPELLRKRTAEVVRTKRIWRWYHHLDVLTPYGEWAIPTSIVGCETGWTWSYTVFNRGGSGASGAYQIMPGTWAAYGGRRFASAAAYAPPYAQHIVARRVWFGQGARAWSCA